MNAKKITIITISLIVSLLFYINHGTLVEAKGTPINFYKKGNLMWLIDTTDTKAYCMETRQELLAKDPDFVDTSYETLLQKVNSDSKYRYNDWRLPTLEELLTLNRCSWRDFRIFASERELQDDTCMDENIFYDGAKSNVFTSTEAGVDEDGKQLYYAVYFGKHRYRRYGAFEFVNPKGSGSWSIGIETSKVPLWIDSGMRLVRDIK